MIESCHGYLRGKGVLELRMMFDCGDPKCRQEHRFRQKCHRDAGVHVVRCPSDERVLHLACAECDNVVLDVIIEPNAALPAVMVQNCHPKVGAWPLFDLKQNALYFRCVECERRSPLIKAGLDPDTIDLDDGEWEGDE